MFEDFKIKAGGVFRRGGGGNQYIQATGGLVTRDGDYLVRQFNESDDLEIISLGSGINNSIEYLLIAGGGAGGSDLGGGGGAGGYLTGTFSPTLTTYPIVIGAGGSAGGGGTGSAGGNGANSTAFGLTAIGGGGGAGSNTPGNPASVGGSGGGGGRSNQPNGASGTVGQGSSGGNSDGNINCGGGGGAGEAGVAGTGTDNGRGGNGLASSITGVSETRAGGGGGGGYGAVNSGVGGAGGGGRGGDSLIGDGLAGLANTGSGGGGTYDGGRVGGAGGSGVCIIRYYSPETFGIQVETLNSNISGIDPRDSAEYMSFENGTFALMGGWNNNLFIVSGNQSAEWWTTTDFTTFTQRTNLSYRISHAAGGMIGDDLYVFAQANDSLLTTFKINKNTYTETIINGDLTSVGEDLEGYRGVSCYFFVNGTIYVLVTSDPNPANLVNVELWKSTDFDSFTYVMDMPNYMVRSNAFVQDGKAYIVSGGQYDGSYTGPNYIDDIWEFDPINETLTSVGTIDTIMQGLWGKIGKIGNVWVFIGGWVFENPSDTSAAYREGAIYYSFDLESWVKTEHAELLPRHAVGSIQNGDSIYVACGHLFNDSYKISFSS